MNDTRRAWMSITFPSTTGSMPAALRSARSIAFRFRPAIGNTNAPAGLSLSHSRSSAATS